MRSRGRRAGVLATLVVLAAALAGCTGVPSSSAPETIKPVQLQDDGSSAADPPIRDVEPRELVQDFLLANAAEPGRSTSARLFLTAAARSRWTDTTATVVSGETVSTFQGGKPVIVVRGRIVGALDQNGTYTPSLDGTGNGGAAAVFEYGIKMVHGQYRIDSLRPGLLLTTDQFPQAFKQHSLYFYDLAGRYLVPDQRWSGLEGTALEQWLVTELAAGPSKALANAVNSDTLPNQAVPRTIAISRGTSTAVEIRGAEALNASARNQLAAQLSYTLAGGAAGDLLRITDGGTAVRIPAAHSSEFSATTFESAGGPVTPEADVYYLNRGKIITDIGGKALTGAANKGTYYLNSVGLERAGVNTALNIAGVVSSGDASRLVVGTQRGGLHPTSIVGALSRPAWVPGTNEVWVGAGRRLYRTTVDSTGRPTKPQVIALPSTASGDEIVSLRLSPEGSRVAMVLQTANGAKQLNVGAVVRRSGQVRIDTLTPLSPEGVAITDVGWIDSPSSDSHELFAVGHPTGSDDAKVYKTNVDGSLWSARTFTLPDPPDAVTVTFGQLAWVSSDQFVWLQSGNSNWDSPDPMGQTPGYAPVYLE